MAALKQRRKTGSTASPLMPYRPLLNPIVFRAASTPKECCDVQRSMGLRAHGLGVSEELWINLKPWRLSS